MPQQLEIHLTQDGSHTLFATQYGVSYHSRYGAIQESRHVFIEAGLHPLLITRRPAAVLEFGLGAGLNAFLTFLGAENQQVPIYYESLEAYPISLEQARTLNYPDLLGHAAVFTAIHEAPWDAVQSLSPCFQLKKVRTRFEDYTNSSRFDLIYFDAFAPGAQPELWETPLLRVAVEALRPGGALVTYCAKGEVKRRLRELGMQVEALPGPPGKREMTRAVKEA
jgi:tRNA U34 5-methylaminomethyl-2-thiouridine-forming methyltransferase MnmC